MDHLNHIEVRVTRVEQALDSLGIKFGSIPELIKVQPQILPILEFYIEHLRKLAISDKCFNVRIWKNHDAEHIFRAVSSVKDGYKDWAATDAKDSFDLLKQSLNDFINAMFNSGGWTDEVHINNIFDVRKL